MISIITAPIYGHINKPHAEDVLSECMLNLRTMFVIAPMPTEL